MLIETTTAEVQIRPADLTTIRVPLNGLLRAWWDLGKVVLLGLLLVYVLGWVRDIERVSRLKAEAPPPFTVITKFQAWDRIYRQPVPHILWPSAPFVWRR